MRKSGIGRPASTLRRLGRARLTGQTLWAARSLLVLPLVVPAAALLAAVPVEESSAVGQGAVVQQAPARSEPRSATLPGDSGFSAQGTPWLGGGGAIAPTAEVQTAAVASSVGSNPPAPRAAEPRNTELFFQIQALQQEVGQLRGLVEELTNQVNRLATDQKTQYRDLDGRIVALRSGASGSAAPGTAAVAPAAGSAAPGPSVAPAPGEREAYQAAIELAQARKFPEATAAFQRFLTDYPGGELAANGSYWLGELYLAQEDLPKARQAFEVVLARHAGSQKAPDAMYKLGVVAHRQGDLAVARSRLEQVVREYPGGSAAALAKTYLAELQ